MATVRKLEKSDLTVAALLLLLTFVPTIGGVIRLMSVANDTTVTQDNARFLAAPVPIVIHVLAATLYCLLGAFQFTPGFRLRWPGFHRRAGRVLAVCGILAGVTGLWMTVFYEIPASLQGPLLYIVRVVVGVAMVASIVIAWSSILRREVARHEAFMIRAYAIGQGAGTQALLMGPYMAIAGELEPLTRDVLMSLAWLINAAVAEWIIVRRRARYSRVSLSSHEPEALHVAVTSRG
jgi:hypothetical protein